MLDDHRSIGRGEYRRGRCEHCGRVVHAGAAAAEQVRVKPGTGRRRLAERGMSKIAPLPRFCAEFSGGMVVQQAIL